MENEELTFMDYIMTPLSELTKHPDFSLEAMAVVGQVTSFTTAQIEKYNLNREAN